MSKNENSIYNKALLFSIVAAITVLIGTIATVFVPMFTSGMHPKVDGLKPYTALQLAGRDIYQAEGCVNCHTQTVRPLKADVLRYGAYSKAGEFAYDRPFLWGSKRTGPDLARIGGKYPDEWHIQHFESPQAFYPKSNMPPYPWLKEKPVNVKETLARMDALSFPYTDEEAAELADLTQLDAIVAYMQVIGTAIEKEAVITVDYDSVPETSPLSGNADAVVLGQNLYKAECAGCHGQNAEGNIGASLVDYSMGELPDNDTYVTIANGFEGAMPGYASKFSQDKIWAIVEYINSLRN
ncbi:cytochrome c oxidase, cbb3-type, subunit II [Denitrovibrio acetiphilus DSM 12809]|uniref:Cytochrome c oxidase, cbb3-type, subunit II n=1 Tax=Denitrovibrio acetiphilus (strain DSM 12809 / NBRC 114555 / N2460) TaxID=522772 RepID=D4H8F9_DENA2|nr:cytochrome-c oxidase, cbb3-type subunit II [Denitrovibrio acetiphilus]ADD68308.1 cytochrome c oxidase, cbb3-type, subunit II [Denitrovibrio acetiphilus DSM 12809]